MYENGALGLGRQPSCCSNNLPAKIAQANSITQFDDGIATTGTVHGTPTTGMPSATAVHSHDYIDDGDQFYVVCESRP